VINAALTHFLLCRKVLIQKRAVHANKRTTGANPKIEVAYESQNAFDFGAVRDMDGDRDRSCARSFG
jgi:hypothetical protein